MHLKNDGPELVVVLLTYQRTEYACRTLNSVVENLRADWPIRFYIADDGSPEEHLEALVNLIPPDRLAGFHAGRLGPGGNWNQAQVTVFGQGVPVILWLEDDWILTDPLNVQPWLDLLEAHEPVGMIRLGVLAVGSELKSLGHAGAFYLEYLPTTQYAYSGNPHLKHRRFWIHYGRYPEGLGAGDTEVGYDGQVRRLMPADGPKIWRPVSLGGYSVFAHIGEEPA